MPTVGLSPKRRLDLDRLPASAQRAVGVAGVQAFHGAYGSDALQRQGVGGDVGGDAVALGDGDDPLHRVPDAHDALRGPLPVVALQLVGDDVTPAQGLHVTAEGAEQRLRLVPLGVADDHGLPAPQIQAARGGLVGHPVRETQGVHHGLLLGGVGPHAASAQGGAQGGVVDGDDGAQARGLVVAEHELLVAVLRHLFEDMHAVSSIPKEGFSDSTTARTFGRISTRAARITAMQRESLGENTTAGKIEGLERLREAAAHPASEQAVERQRERGKLTARERIELLLDEGTFVELDRYRVHRSYNFGLGRTGPWATGSWWGMVKSRGARCACSA